MFPRAPWNEILTHHCLILHKTLKLPLPVENRGPFGNHQKYSCQETQPFLYRGVGRWGQSADKEGKLLARGNRTPSPGLGESRRMMNGGHQQLRLLSGFTNTFPWLTFRPAGKWQHTQSTQTDHAPCHSVCCLLAGRTRSPGAAAVIQENTR